MIRFHPGDLRLDGAYACNACGRGPVVATQDLPIPGTRRVRVLLVCADCATVPPEACGSCAGEGSQVRSYCPRAHACGGTCPDVVSDDVDCPACEGTGVEGGGRPSGAQVIADARAWGRVRRILS